ncbi:MAG TPA: asparagine synthase (glutamine-hydrolyzing), partial [Burkholderiales bacterium]|nr:asparagine synthase (glutamine-hydrolyzing) [Burkholderiales bacterium]
MDDAIAHRGPDDEGVWFDATANVYLGHRRLSIVDVEGGHQPMWTADGALGIIFNGEIYNHLDLRRELVALGHAFVTDHSDTEVLLHAYRAWGPAFVQRLNGMWAFALYDRVRRRVFLSRDRFGKKPLYYTLAGDTLIFASELSAMRAHPRTPTRLSTRGVRKYFAYGYIPAPMSIIDGVLKLPGGHSLTFDLATRKISIDKYWDFRIEPFESIPRDPEREWGEHLVELLSAAVKRRLMSDVPLGFFLSGGVDSSSVTALATRHVDADRVNTFSIGFEEASFDESAYARRVALLLQTRHHPEMLSMQRARGLLPDIVARLDEPMGDSSLLPTYLLSQHTRKHVTVALGGDGADELFAGYDPFRALAAADVYRKLMPRPVHHAIHMIMARLPVSHVNMSFDFRVKRTLRGLSYPPQYWLPVWMSPLDPQELPQLFGEPVDLEDLYSEAIEQWDACRDLGLVDKALQFYTKLYLQDDILVKVDRASMMHSLEVRAPYLDIELVDFVRRLPHQYKYRNGTTKYLLKKALEPILPRDILYRSKRGFGVPIGAWFRDGAFDWREQSP